MKDNNGLTRRRFIKMLGTATAAVAVSSCVGTDAMEKAYKASLQKVPCTGCRRCMPCPYGVDIAGVFAFANAIDDAATPRQILADYDKAVEPLRQANHCIDCGKCSPLCPHRIKIPATLDLIDAKIEELKQL